MVGMLRCGDVARVLGALALANAAIANLESTTARYFMKTFGFSVGQVSVFYMFTSVPSCLMSGLAGAVANHIGAWRVMGLGLALQGVFTLLGPKDVLCMEMLCFALLGAGMGATDGTAPAILGDIADSKFGGTGRIYLMSNIAVQSGFLCVLDRGSAWVEVRNSQRRGGVKTRSLGGRLASRVMRCGTHEAGSVTSTYAECADSEERVGSCHR